MRLWLKQFPLLWLPRVASLGFVICDPILTSILTYVSRFYRLLRVSCSSLPLSLLPAGLPDSIFAHSSRIQNGERRPATTSVLLLNSPPLVQSKLLRPRRSHGHVPSHATRRRSPALRRILPLLPHCHAAWPRAPRGKPRRQGVSSSQRSRQAHSAAHHIPYAL